MIKSKSLCFFLPVVPEIQHPTWPYTMPASYPSHLFFLRKRDQKKVKKEWGKRREKEKLENKEESRQQDKMWHHHWKEKAQKHGAERRPYWRGKKSLVSLVSSTRLKGQMESQWGSLSGSHYWNRKVFFSFYTHTKSVLEAASFKGLLSFPS